MSDFNRSMNQARNFHKLLMYLIGVVLLIALYVYGTIGYFAYRLAPKVLPVVEHSLDVVDHSLQRIDQENKGK